MPIDWKKYGVEDDEDEQKGIDGIDWTKYGVSDDTGGINWDKYITNPEQEVINSETNQMRQASEAAGPSIDPPKPTYMESIRRTLGNPLEAVKTAIGQTPAVGREALNIIRRPSEIVSEYATPDASLIGRDGIIPGTNARRSFLEETGQRPATGFAEKALGTIAAPFAVPGAGLGAGTGLYRAAGEALETLAPRLGNTLGGRVAREGLREAAVGAPLGAGQELATGEGNLKQVAISGAVGGALGGTLGAAGPLVGAAARKVGSALEGARARELPILGISPFAKKSGQYTHEMDTRSHIQSKTKAEKTSFMDKVQNFYNKTLNNLEAINQFDKDTAKLLGRELKPSEQSYKLALNSRGSDMTSRHILLENMVDSMGNEGGQSLKAITEKLPKGKTVDFEDYLINKHAITRMGRGEKVFPDRMQMTPEKSGAKVAEYEAKHPEFKQIADEYYQFNKDMGQRWLVDTGIVSQKDWDGMLAANPHYAPNNRVFSEIEKPKIQGSKGGFSGQGSPIKTATGSQRKIVSPLESTIEHVDKYVKTAKRNEVMQSMYRNVQENPEAFKGLIDIVEQPKGMEDIKNVLLDGEGIDDILNRFNENFEKAMKKPNLQNGDIVRGLINGEPVYMRVSDPQLLEALTNLSPAAQNIVVKSVGQVTRVMKLLTTGINPVFSLTRNIFRDIPTAYVNSKSTDNIAVFSKDLVLSVIDILGNRKMYKSFKSVGGGHSSAIASDRNLLAQSKRAILPQNNKTSLIKKGFNAIENFTNAVESAPRLGEYRRLTKDGSYDSKIKGLFEANDVTVNFNRRGEVTKEVDAFIPYLNAALQGIDKFVRTYKDNPVKAGIKSFTAVTIPTIVLYAINHDNPEYNKLSNYVKDNFFLIPKSDGTFIKFPKSREIGVPFGSLVERSLRKWYDQDPEAFKDFSETVKTAFTPPTATIAQPLVDIARNKNFVNAPIVPGDLQGNSPRQQFDEKTSEPSKFIGDKLNISPKQIDYLIRSYTGVIGQLGIPLSTKGGSLMDTLEKQVTSDPLYSNDISRDFYDKKKKMDEANADFKKTGIQNKDFNPGLRNAYNKAASTVGDIRKEIDRIQKNELLSKEQREQQIRAYQATINEIYKSLNDAAKAGGG